MENTPIPPRQRVRRTDRYAAQAETTGQPFMNEQPGYPGQSMPPVQSAYPVPQEQPVPPAQPVLPRQPLAQQPAVTRQTSMPVQPGYPSQQPIRANAARPVRPAQIPQAPMQTPPPSQSLYRSAMQQQRQQDVRQPRYAPREEPGTARPAQRTLPRALQQNDSGWRMPAAEGRPAPRPAAAPDRAARRSIPPMEEAPEAAKSGKLPGWMTTLLCLTLVGVMALVAGIALMKAWLKTDLERREAEYRAVLNNYHVTESADGSRAVTYQAYIEKYAREYNLQPAFVTAIIRNESSFRTNAESSVGARGLMQMMPDTAEWIAGKLNDGSYHFDRMYDAETNIRYGCWYLGYISSLFRGDPVLIAAAYHAGQGNVRGWLGNRELSADGLTIPIEKLPIAETRQYAGRVTQAYGIYQTLLYTPDAPPAVQSYDGRAAAGVLLSAER